MPALVENNFIYIAQPPLYRVTRKKISRYIQSEKEMDDYLLELGLSDIHIFLDKSQEPLNTDQRKALFDAILDVESLVMRIERKGISFREFMASRNSAGLLPRFQVTMQEGVRFAYSYDELETLRVQDEEQQRLIHKETLASIPDEERTVDMQDFHASRLNFVELYEEEHLHNLLNKLKPFHLDLQHYLIADGVSLELSDDEHKRVPFSTLKELMEHIRNNGRKGIEIQRYKGLAEMNPDQLWETTMDPERRTLVKVTVPDMVAADYMFTMLMGDAVPPRRDFINKHALSVGNLDI
jgi:DNA gyrase subunit B